LSHNRDLTVDNGGMHYASAEHIRAPLFCTYYAFGEKFAYFNKLYNVNEFYALQNKIFVSRKNVYKLNCLT